MKEFVSREATELKDRIAMNDNVSEGERLCKIM